MMAEADMYIIIIFRKTSLKVYYNIKNKMFNKMNYCSNFKFVSNYYK